MPSTYTQLGLEIQADTENDTTWGQKANNVFKMVDDAIGGVVAVVAVTGGVTMAFSDGVTDQAGRHHVIQFTSGNISGVVATMIMPAIQKTWVIQNDSTAAVAIRTAGGSAFTLPSGVDSLVLGASDTLALAMPDFYALTINTATGSAAAPAIRFANDPNTGIYATANDTMAFSVAGAKQLGLTTDGVTFDGGIGAAVDFTSGTVAAPAITFGDANTGILATAANTLAFSVGGKQIISFASDEIVSTGNLTIAGLTASSITVSSGTAAAPGITFGDANTGIYATAANTLALSVGGKQIISFASDEIVSTGNLTVAGLTASTFTVGSVVDFTSGSAAAPAITFGDTNTGIYATAAGTFSLSVGGAQRLIVTSDSFSLNEVIIVPDGTAGTPAYVFSGDTDTGFYLSAAGTLGIAVGGGGMAQFTSDGITVLGTDKLHMPSGTVALPAINFGGRGDLGWYTAASGEMSLSIAGSEVWQMNAARMALINGGSAVVPVLSINNDGNTGFYSTAGDILSISVGGTNVGRWTSTGLAVLGGAVGSV